MVGRPPRIGGIVLCLMIPFLTFHQGLSLALMMLLGWSDDVLDLSPLLKLLVETLLAWFATYNIYAVVWIVFFINAFNLSDNMDGLALGLGIVASVCMGDVLLTLLLLLILPLNWKPARIYLGDFGSLSLGYLLSLRVLETPETVWFVAIPLVDTAFVTVTRLMRKRSPLKGGRDHLSHRLAEHVGEERAVLLLILAGSIIAFLFKGPLELF